MQLPVVPGKTIIGVLLRVGFERVGQKGSHVKLQNRLGRVVIVPLHRELLPGTLQSVLRQADLSVEWLRMQL